MKPKTQERAALFLLILYCVDLAWKLANWSKLFKGLDWRMIALALTVRFAFMGFLLYLFMLARKAARDAAKR